MPESPNLAKCAKCHKLFVPVLEARKCPECTAEYEQKVYLVEHAIYFGLKTTAQDITEYTQLPHEEVVKILKSLRYLNDSIHADTSCARCKTGVAQTGSEFCLDCRLYLHNLLKSATGALSNKLAQQAYAAKASSPVNNVLTELEKKRAMTSAEVIGPRRPRFK